MKAILPSAECPTWVKYPKEYLKLLHDEQHIFLPWYLYDEQEDFLYRFTGVQKRYPSRKLFPFARRDDNDDIACWEENRPGKVVIIHDFASPGWEQREIFDSFDDWHQFALSEKWDDEDQ